LPFNTGDVGTPAPGFAGRCNTKHKKSSELGII
jgi:hypothetical protein